MACRRRPLNIDAAATRDAPADTRGWTASAGAGALCAGCWSALRNAGGRMEEESTCRKRTRRTDRADALPGAISEGDLDGDLYYVSWDPGLVQALPAPGPAPPVESEPSSSDRLAGGS